MTGKIDSGDGGDSRILCGNIFGDLYLIIIRTI